MGLWTKESDYCLSHPSGWTIAKYIMRKAPVYILWQGDTQKGHFYDARDAMRRHTELIGSFPSDDS